ncbi:hypothetical protein N9B24_03210, partial [bacterium]|nr:hypothetical protein [bacterium]
GVIRSKIAEWITNHSFRVSELAGQEIPGFWNNAAISILDTEGDQRPLGRITKHENGVLTFTSTTFGKPTSEIQHRNTESEEDSETDHELKRDVIIELNAELEAPVLATRLLLGIPLDAPLPALDIRLGTTRGTNALLTRGGR